MSNFRDELIREVAATFRSFGGGKVNEYNPISIIMKDEPAQFAAGVDIGQVVDFIVQRACEEIDRRMSLVEKELK